MIKIPKDVYMETLTSLIYDDDKLVIYKWLSKELEIHVNIAKEILAEFWDNHKNDGIIATFMLIGKTNDGGIKVEVVKEVDLDKYINKYDKLVSKHIYSLQKALPDIEALARAGKGDAKFGAIKCKESVILSDEELFKRRWGSNIEFQIRYSNQNDVKKMEKKVDQVEKKNDDEKKRDVKNNNENIKKIDVKNKSEANIESKKISPPTKLKPGDKKSIQKKPAQSTKVGFNNLFGKVSNQKKILPVKNEESTDKPSTLKESSLNNIFDKKSNQNELLDSASSSEKQKKELKTLSDPKDDFGSDIDFDSLIEIDKSSSPPFTKDTLSKSSLKKESKIITKNKKSSIKKSITNRGTKRERSQDTSDSCKKRKRIIVHESSDESGASGKDENEEEEEEEEEHTLFESSELKEIPSPPKQRVQSFPAVKQIGGKRKVKKTIDKTYMDEEGFMVTKKVQVMESASEDDEPAPAPVEPKKKALAAPSKTTAKSKKVGNKQTTLTSFFKRA